MLLLPEKKRRAVGNGAGVRGATLDHDSTPAKPNSQACNQERVLWK